MFLMFLILLFRAFSTFAIPRGEIADRLSVTVTLMLAAVAFQFIVSTMLPKVSYLTVMDYYMLSGFVMLILMVLENAVCGAIESDDVGNAIDLWCSIVFGGMLNIFYIRKIAHF